MIEIELPLPNECEHPNARCHWRKKAAAVKVSREYARLVTQNRIQIFDITKQLVTPILNPRYTLKFWVTRKRDEDGLIAWMKATLDGIADSGLIENDSQLKLEGVEQLSGIGATHGKSGVLITIWSGDTPTPKQPWKGY